MIRTIRQAIVGAALACCLLPFREIAHAGGALPIPGTSPPESILLTIKASPAAQLQTTLTIQARDRSASLLARSERVRSGSLAPSDAYATIRDGDGLRTFTVEAGGDLHGADGWRVRLAPAARVRLLAYIRTLRSMHYGYPATWKQADDLIPVKHTVTVVDLEKGLSFRAQRRAGKHHADVQPVSRRDTSIMKQMYDGKWSWRRRAILVKTNGRVLAASMHGMPHGGDGIPDNGFRGHFCIHFLNSSTHGSGHIDPDHQYMVRKAAGMLSADTAGADPYELAETLLLAVRAGDTHTVSALLAVCANANELNWLTGDGQTVVGPVSFPASAREAASEMLAVDLPVRIQLIDARGGRTNLSVIFQMKRSAPTERWSIAGIHRR